MMDGYFTKGAHHLNVNVLNREICWKIPTSEYSGIDSIPQLPNLLFPGGNGCLVCAVGDKGHPRIVQK